MVMPKNIAKGPPGETRRIVRALTEQGFSRMEISRRLGIAEGNVGYHRRQMRLEDAAGKKGKA